jgi:hypothetical protein
MRAGLKAVLGLGVAAAIVGAVAVGGPARARASARRDASREWARLARCLVGDDALAGEKPSERLRRIELGVAARKASGAAEARDADWPRRCAGAAAKLEKAWRKAHDDESGDRAALTSQTILQPVSDIGSFLERDQPSASSREATLLDASLWPAAARELSPEPADATDVLAAPPPAVIALTKPTTIAPIYADEGMLNGVEAVHARSARVQFYKKDDVCVFGGDEDASRTLLHVRCHPVSARIPGGASRTLVGLDEGAPPMLAVFDYTEGGVFSAATGERLVAAGTPTIEGAWAKANGFVAALDRPVVTRGGNSTFVPTYTLVRRLADGTASRTPLDRPRNRDGEVFDAVVVPGWMLWLEGPSQHEHALHAREILEGEPAVGPVLDVGVVPDGYDLQRRAVSCRTRDALFVSLGDVQGHTALAARAAGRWTVVRADVEGGRLTCRGAEAVLTALQPGDAGKYDYGKKEPLEIVQARCTPERCETASVRVPAVVTTRGDIDHGDRIGAADVGGKVALLTLGSTVQLRLAPLSDLARAPVTTVAEGEYEHGGRIVHGIYLLPREDAAVVVLNTSDGSFAFRLDAAGALTPIAVDR